MTKDQKSSCEKSSDPEEKQNLVGRGLSRRELLGSTAVGAAAGALGVVGLSGALAAPPPHAQGNPPPHARGQRILLKGGIVLSMDPEIGSFEKADILVDGKTIVSVGPNLIGKGKVVDCTGMIIMPGFVNTHHHQYQLFARGIIADGIHIRGSEWPLRTYTSIVGSHWTSGRVVSETDELILDLGRSPYTPDDCYLAELVASLSEINNGVTTGIDTSQSSHTPEHTDALIHGLMDSGRRTLYAYSGGRSDQPGYEYPGSIGDPSTGIGRLRNQFFSSGDQLVTLGLGGGVSANSLQLARHYEAPLISHTFGDANAAAIAANEDILGPDQTYIHTTRFSDDTYSMIASSGGHVSLAVPIEMQMAHGMPPIQQAREHGITPSLSSDVETNMTADFFTIMRSAFTLQRALLNEEFIAGATGAIPKLLTCEEVLSMATIAGARAAHLGDKVGSLSPGKEADIIVLDATRINTIPLNNAPGAVVTLMDTSNVRHVMIAGEFKKWDYKLVGVNEKKLRDDVENARDRMLAELQAGNPAYLAPFLTSCCIDSYADL